MSAADLAALRERARVASEKMLPLALARARWDAARIAALQAERLRALLAHAAECSPFYARRMGGLDAARFELADLARIAPVAKGELMAELDAVFTDRRVTRALAEDALAATTTEPVPLFGRYLAQATGGSSGQRGVFVCEAETWAEVSAGAIRVLVAAAPGVKTIAMVAAPSPVHSTGLAPAMAPRESPIAIVPVPATLPFAEIVARLNQARPQQLVGYPSVVARLAHSRGAGELAIEPVSIATTSEMLTPGMRAAIRAGFGVPLTDVFGSTEGLMGGSEPDDDVFAFNSDTCIVELVDAEDRPVPPGTPSHHILVTNLANHVQPLIRYRIDDSFTRAPDAPNHGRLRATVEGRADSPLRWGAVEIHPLVIRAVLLKHREVLDYQVRQTADGVELALVAPALSSSAVLCEAIARALGSAGLTQPRVEARTVESLARLRETGKLRRFVPLPRSA